MERFTGKRVLVTAAGSGIGRCTAERFHTEGATVFACDVGPESLETLAPAIGRQVCDASDEAAVDALFDAADRFLGGLDILINTVGIAGETASIENSGAEAWRRCLEVNLMSAFLCTRRAMPLLREAGGGSIVNFSSTAGLFGYPYRSAYCTAKWGIIGLTKTAAQEGGPAGIRVNAICPGAVEGERMDRVIAAEAKAKGLNEDAIRAAYTADSSLKRWVTADDLAETVMFLCSDQGRMISGQALPVDGHTETL